MIGGRVIAEFLKPQFGPGQYLIQSLCLCSGAVSPTRAVRRPLRAFRETASLFVVVPNFELFRGCPRNAKLTAQFGSKKAGVAGNRSPAKTA